MNSNVKKWDRFHWKPNPQSVLNVPSMIKGAEFLQDCKTVQDWGTGEGIFKNFRVDALGVDGSDTPGADLKYVDLTTYETNCEGIFLRHVLEHNYEWKKILHNVLKSASKKVCVVMFIPFIDGETKEQHFYPMGVPDLAIGRQEFLDILAEYPVTYETEKLYGSDNEEMVYITRK